MGWDVAVFSVSVGLRYEMTAFVTGQRDVGPLVTTALGLHVRLGDVWM